MPQAAASLGVPVFCIMIFFLLFFFFTLTGCTALTWPHNRRKREKKSPDLKQLLLNAEQHLFSVEQGDLQHAGAGIGPLGSPKWGYLIFSSLATHGTCRDGCSLSLWGDCDTQGCSSRHLELHRDGEAQGTLCHPVGLVCLLLDGKGWGTTPLLLCPSLLCPEGRCAPESCSQAFVLWHLLESRAGSVAHVQGGCWCQGSGPCHKPGLGLALAWNKRNTWFIQVIGW